MAFFLTNRAKQDLREIARYTQKEWGLRQRNTYLTQLDKAFHILSDAPDKGKKCNLIRSGYFKYLIGKHLIFFRIYGTKDIEIVRILHESMDIEKQLGSD